MHCRWLNHFTDRRVVISTGVGRNERWCEDPVNQSPSSHCCSDRVFPAAVDTIKQTRLLSASSASALFVPEPVSVGGYWDFSLYVQSAHVTSWTHSGLQRECWDCRHEFTVKVHQAMMSRLWLSSWWPQRVLRLRLCGRECLSVITIAPVRQEGQSKKEEGEILTWIFVIACFYFEEQ